MLLVYTVSAIVAGVLVLLALFGADHHIGSEIHVDGADQDSETGHWLPFFSLRFYTYFFAGFGTTGLLLHYFTKVDATLMAWIAAAVGLGSGMGVSILVRLLRITEASGSASDKDVLGKEAQVLVAIRGTNPGRIRCTVKGDIIDFLAISDSPDPIEVGTSVVVVAMENGQAQVISRQSLFEDDALPQRTS